MTEIKSCSVEQTEELAYKIGKNLKGNETLALFGGLGMGKTAFTRGLVRGLESCDSVSSPTFAIVNEYSGRCKIYHFDMYRITSWEDLDSTGFFDFLGNGVSVIEWSENIENALPDDAIKIEISKLSENSRIFKIEGDVEIC